jgi:hypothetical protein
MSSEIDKYLEPDQEKAGVACETEADFYLAEANERVSEAGHCLRALLMANPRDIDILDDFQLLLVRCTQGASFIDKIASDAARLDKKEREDRRAARVKIPYSEVHGARENWDVG